MVTGSLLSVMIFGSGKCVEEVNKQQRSVEMEGAIMVMFTWVLNKLSEEDH